MNKKVQLISNNQSISKYKKITPKMTSNNTPAGYTASATSQASGAYYPYYAYDEDAGTSFAGALSTAPVSNQITMPSPKVPKALRFACCGSYSDVTFTFWGSTDNGATKTTLLVLRGDYIFSEVFKKFNWNSTAYTTLGMTSNKTSSDNYFYITYLDFYELSPSGTITIN